MLAAVSVVLASVMLPPPVINPAKHVSRSGECVLEVDPSEMYGEGKGSYVLRQGDKILWCGERPYTFLDASVGDDGVVAGYAYDAGVSPGRDNGAVHLVILDPGGKERLHERLPRRDSLIIDGGPEPEVDGIVFHPEHDRVVFRVSRVADDEVWTPYRLSTGAALTPFRPASQMNDTEIQISLLQAEPLPGTPLTVVHWSRVNWKTESSGSRYTLIDDQGRPVWRLELPRDYVARKGDKKAQERLDELQQLGGILDTTQPSSFEVRVAATMERVRYRVTAGPSGWKVTESAREPYTIEKAAPVAEPVPERPLRYLGAVPLGRRAGQTAIRGLQDFDIDADGRIGFARIDGRCELTLVLLTPSDRDAVNEMMLGDTGAKDCYGPLIAWAGGSTWLVTTEYARGGADPIGWWVDVSFRETRPLRLPADHTVHAVAGRPAGGAIVLAEQTTRRAIGSDSRNVLLWIRPDGSVEPRFSEPAGSSASEILSPEDIAVTTTGATVVIDVIEHEISILGENGTIQSVIDLEKAWGRKPNYPSGIARDIDGGFICEDFDAPVPFVRMRHDGSVLGELRPRYPDGRATGRLFRVRAAPDGSLWGSDGEALLRLGEDGVVLDTIGSAASTEDLGEIAAITLDSMDRIYAADRRSGAVHVFNKEGESLHICRPEPGDIKEALQSPSLTVSTDGRVFLRPDEGFDEDGRFLEFSPSGDLIDRHPWKDRGRLWDPAVGGFWAVNWHDVSQVDEQGKVLRTIRRRMDRRWLEFVSDAVAAADGSVAVATSQSGHKNRYPPTINLYTSDGTATAMIRLSAEPHGFAYDGRHVAAWQSGAVYLFDASGRALLQFRPRPGGKPADGWPLLLAAQGRELWMLDNATKTIHRFALP